MTKIIGLMNSYSENISGGDIHFIEIFKRLKGKKLVITSKLGEKTCKKMALSAKYFITSQEKKIKNICFTYFKRTFKALSLLTRLDDHYNFIYSSSDFLPDTIPAFFYKKRFPKTKWIVLIHLLLPSLFRDYTKSFSPQNSFFFPGFKRTLYFFGQRLTIFLANKKANKILVLNNLDKKLLVDKLKVKANKVKVTSNGISYKKAKLAEKEKIYDGIFIGRFHHQKGIFDLVKIWQFVCQKKPKAKLCLIGSGSPNFTQKIKKKIKSLKIEKNIDLKGAKFAKEKFLLLKLSRIFVYPSLYESFALVIAEAMACGLPAIAYKLPIYEEIYADNLLTVPLGEKQAFAKIIIKLLDNKKQQRILGKKSQQFIKKYDWDKVFKKELQLINEEKNY